MKSHNMRQRLLEELGVPNDAYMVIKCIKTASTPLQTIEKYSGLSKERTRKILDYLVHKRYIVKELKKERYRRGTQLRVVMFRVAQEMKNS